MTYAEKLMSPKWQKRRLEVLQRDNFKCKLCGDTETTLHVHHEEYNNEPWDVELDKLKTLCKHCHYLSEIYKKSKTTTLLAVRKLTTFFKEKPLIVSSFYMNGDPNTTILIFDLWSEEKKELKAQYSIKIDELKDAINYLSVISTERAND